MLKKLFLMAGAAIAGIYITSDEGKNARKSLLKKKNIVEPIIKDLLKQVNEIIEGNGEIVSENIRANVDLLVKEIKKSLLNLEIDKVTETVKDAIRVTSKKLSSLENDVEKVKLAEKQEKVSPKMSKKILNEVEAKIEKKVKEIKK